MCPAQPAALPGVLVRDDYPGDVQAVTRETIVITWMDGAVATYEDIRHSTQGDWLYIYNGADGVTMLWRFPITNIRAVGAKPWTPDADVELPSGNGREESYAP